MRLSMNTSFGGDEHGEDDDSELSDAPPTPARGTGEPLASNSMGASNTASGSSLESNPPGQDVSCQDRNSKAACKDQQQKAKHWVYEEAMERNIFADPPIIEHSRRRRPLARRPNDESSGQIAINSAAALPPMLSSKRKRRGVTSTDAELGVIEGSHDISNIHSTRAKIDTPSTVENSPSQSNKEGSPVMYSHRRRKRGKREVKHERRELKPLIPSHDAYRAKAIQSEADSERESDDESVSNQFSEAIAAMTKEKARATDELSPLQVADKHQHQPADVRSGSLKVRLKRSKLPTNKPTESHIPTSDQQLGEKEAKRGDDDPNLNMNEPAGASRRWTRSQKNNREGATPHSARQSKDHTSDPHSSSTSAVDILNCLVDATDRSLRNDDDSSERPNVTVASGKKDDEDIVVEDDDEVLSDGSLIDDADTCTYGRNLSEGGKGVGREKRGTAEYREEKGSTRHFSARRVQPSTGSEAAKDEAKTQSGMVASRAREKKPIETKMLPSSTMHHSKEPPILSSPRKDQRQKPASKVVRRVQSGMMSMLDSLMGSSPKGMQSRPASAQQMLGAQNQTTSLAPSKPAISSQELSKVAASVSGQKSTLVPVSSPWSRPIDLKGAHGEHVT